MNPLRRLAFLSLLPLALAAACSASVAVDEPTGNTSTSTSGTGGAPVTTTSSTTGVGAGPVTSSSSSTSASSGGSFGCTGAGDQQILAVTGIWPILNQCGMMFIGNEPLQLECIEDQSGLSSGCSGCFDAYLNCIIMNCLSQCIADPQSQPCIECRKQNCDAAFLMCSGLPAAP